MAECWGAFVAIRGVQDDYLVEGSLAGPQGESNVLIHLVDVVIPEADFGSYLGACCEVYGYGPVARIWGPSPLLWP